MRTLREVSQTITAAIEAGRIGTPCSVRLVAHHMADHGATRDLLGDALDQACRWLGDSPTRLAAFGGAESGQISALLQFPRGQCALISTGTRGNLGPLLEVIVVGNQGVLMWEPSDGPDGEVTTAPGLVLSQQATSLLQAVDASLQSRGAVTPGRIEPGGKPATPQASDSPTPRDVRLRTAIHRGASLSEPYGVLLVAGAQTHQENYAQALAADPRCRLIGLTDEPDVPPRRAALNAQLARELDIPLIEDFGAALARDDVHIASICAEPYRRSRCILRSARAGKHLYLDKPLTASVQEADEVVKAVREAGVVSQMFSQVHTATAQRARRAVKSGALGEIIAVHCDLFFAKGPSGTARLGKPRLESDHPTRFELVESKREMFNVGVYPLVFIYWLLGREPRRVYAVTANYFFREHQQNDMEDYAEVLLELEGGVIGTLAVGRTGWRSSPMGGIYRTYLIGTKGTALIDTYRPRLAIWANEQPWQPPRRHPEDPMGMWSSTQQEVAVAPKTAWITASEPDYGDARFFVDCIEKQQSSDVSAAEGALACEVLAGAYSSAAGGNLVTLPIQRT